ncbi:hypothetical protein HN51_035760 [Arachis hypogaea]
MFNQDKLVPILNDAKRVVLGVGHKGFTKKATTTSEFGVGPGIAEEGDDIFSDESDAGSQEEVQVTLSAPQPQPQEQTTNSSNQVASTSFRPPRPKQQILRPHVAPVTAPTPLMKLVSAPRPLPPPTLTPPPTAPFAPVPRSLHPNQIPRISPETVAATSSGTAARIFKFMPTPGLNLQKKK